ncbi:MAG TPA: PQQ-dependent sugar dehydrogenase [Vicinamibacteria bacterium]|nr:PQQ-dependent sugar dehydrogenase [Vicinamibacteria bacterium]
MRSSVSQALFFAGALTVAAGAGAFRPALADHQPSSEIADPFEIGVKEVAAGLTSPVTIVSAFDGSGRLFVVDQVGLVRVLTPGGALLPEPFLDLRAKLVPLNPFFDERGLLGLAFHPDYHVNGRFFVYYSAPLRAGAPAGFNHSATFAEYRISADPDRGDPASERIFLQVDEPQSNHNGGTIAFGPDGFLYVSLGDGGGANDVGLGHVDDWYADNGGGNGQDVEQNLLGNILRLDVDAGSPYGIPPDNPFTATPGCADGCDEIYAYGFRNPYRFSFDMATGDLLVGDAGQGLYEEVSLVEKGGNYGWNVKEGAHCFDAENNRVSPPDCPDEVLSGVRAGDLLVDPVIEYRNANHPQGGLGVAVVGGAVYRGRILPQLRGRYVFGDWSTSFGGPPNGTLFAATPRKQTFWRIQELKIANRPNGRLNHRVLGFGQDPDGEVYVGTSDNIGPSGSTGRVFQLIRPSGR